MITDKQVVDALREVTHPEIKRNLVELEMIRDVSVEDGSVTLTLALPFAGIPIKDDLVRVVKGAVAKLDATLQVEVNLT